MKQTKIKQTKIKRVKIESILLTIAYNLQSLHNELLIYIKEHQGTQGFIYTDFADMDDIKALKYSYGDKLKERKVAGIRVRNNEIQIFCRAITAPRYSITSLQKAQNWEYLNPNYIVVPETIFSIADSIEKYVEKNEY